MTTEISLEKIKESIVENSQEYFKVTGESFKDDFLLLLVDSLVDEYKARRNYPGYFTEDQINADVASYFSRKSAYFAMKIIPTIIGKIGAEGQQSHSENGISRSWEAENWFPDVIPYCEVV